MKSLNYDSDNFWTSLDDHLSLREEEGSSKTDTKVKSIIEEFTDNPIISEKDNLGK